MVEDLKQTNPEPLKIETSKTPESGVEGVAEYKAGEQVPEAENKPVQEAFPNSTFHPSADGPNSAQPAPTLVDQSLVQVEKVLEENIAPYFGQLNTSQQAKFKAEGEKVTKEIAQALKEVKINVVKIFQLIWAWLLFLPGINKLFLEQEAKIKTDKILRIKDSQF